MVYVNRIDSRPEPVHVNYQQYNIAYTEHIEDIKDNVLIIPELFYCKVFNFRKIRKVIWWLSVDSFSYFFYRISSNKIYARILNKSITLLNQISLSKGLMKKLELSKRRKELARLSLLDNVENLVQCEYIKSFLQIHGIKNIIMLSDYLRNEFLEAKVEFREKSRDNIVLYNPRKGLNFSKCLIKFCKDVVFVPLINLSPAEMRARMSQAKLYIDFGEHPGKDRIPREAAMLGCCVIVGRNGSAAYFEDVSIPEQYKFDREVKNIPDIAVAIKDTLLNYEKCIKDFEPYRLIISQEKELFLHTVKNLFVKE